MPVGLESRETDFLHGCPALAEVLGKHMTGILEFGIQGLFDNIDHVLLLMSVRKMWTWDWAQLYIARWLTARMEQEGKRME